MVITLTLLLIILGFTTYNLLKKIEKYEDQIKLDNEDIEIYKIFLSNLSDTIESSNKKLKEIDAKGSFDSDDEIGFFFQQILLFQSQLNNFTINK